MLAEAYKYVLAIDKYRNMSKAAYELCISQPALTKYINRLENSLQVKLFNRSSSPITLTSAGELFIEKARIIYSLEQDLESELKNSNANITGKIVFGITGEMGKLSLPYILPEFKKRFANLEIEIRESNNATLLNEMAQGKIDIIMAAETMCPSNVKYELLDEDPIILAMPAINPIAQSFDLSTNSPLTPYFLNPDLIKHQDFVCISAHQGMGILARNFFKKYHLKPNIVLNISTHETALRMASTGMGMIFTPIRTPLRITLLKPMAYFSIENPIYCRKRVLYYRNDIPLSPAAITFLNTVKSLVATGNELHGPAYQLIHKPFKQIIPLA